MAYDTTDGITMTGQTRLTDSAGEANDVATEMTIPIFPGDGINMDAKADGTGVVISATGVSKDYLDGLAEAWTFTLDDGSTVVKNVLVNINTAQSNENLYDVDVEV